MLTKKSLLITLLLIVCCSAFAVSSINDYYSDQELAEKLLKGETLEAYSVNNQSTKVLAPKNTESEKLAIAAENNPNAFSQALVAFVPYPESWGIFTDDEKFLAVYNLMQKVSTMKGITYDSYSAGGEATLFTETYLISNPSKKNSKKNDTVARYVPAQMQAYAYMKDTKFGGNIYCLNYHSSKDEIFLEITNTEKMKYMGISCVKEKDLHMYVDTVMTEEGIVVYGLAVCYNQKPQVNVLVTKVDLPSAFLKRVTSLKNWFVQLVEQQ